VLESLYEGGAEVSLGFSRSDILFVLFCFI